MLSYLLAGAVIGPVVSQSLLDFMIFLIFVCFVRDYARHKGHYNFALRKPFLFEYGFIFYILAIVAGFIILNITDSEAWFRLHKFHWIINFYLFVWAFARYELNPTKLAKFFGFAYLAPNIYGLYVTMSNYDWSSRRTIASTRLLGLLESATYHAHANGVILMFFLIILFFQFKKLSKGYQILSVIGLSLMTLGIFLTFTRGIWLSLTLTTLIFLLFHHRRFLVVGLFAGLLLISSLYSFSDSFRDRVHHSMETKTADYERWDLFSVHIAMIKDNPIFGIGYSNSLSHTPREVWTKYGYNTEKINSHAHNQLLNVMATTGVMGLIPFLIFYFWFFVTNLRLVLKYRAAKMCNHYTIAIACLMAQTEFTLANLTDVGFEYTKIRSIILLVWAIVLVMWQDRAKISAI